MWLVYLSSFFPQEGFEPTDVEGAHLPEDLGSRPWEKQHLGMKGVRSPVSQSPPPFSLPLHPNSKVLYEAVSPVFIFLINKAGGGWAIWSLRNLAALTRIPPWFPGSLWTRPFFLCSLWFWLTSVLPSIWQERRMFSLRN